MIMPELYEAIKKEIEGKITMSCNIQKYLEEKGFEFCRLNTPSGRIIMEVYDVCVIVEIGGGRFGVTGIYD